MFFLIPPVTLSENTHSFWISRASENTSRASRCCSRSSVRTCSPATTTGPAVTTTPAAAIAPSLATLPTGIDFLNHSASPARNSSQSRKIARPGK